MISFNPDYLSYLISFLLIIIPARDVIIKGHPKWWKRISIAGWLLLVIAVVNFANSVLISISDKKDKEQLQKHEDSIRHAEIKTIVDSINLQLEPLKMHINDKKQIIHDRDTPLIFICSTRSVYKKSQIEDTLNYKIRFCNQSSVDAENVNVRIFSYSTKSGTLYKCAPVDVFKKYSISRASFSEYSNSLFGNKLAAFDSVYFYVKGNYKNEKKDIDFVLMWGAERDSIFITSPVLHDIVIKNMHKLKLF